MKTKIESNETYHSNKRFISSSGVKKIHKKSIYHYLNELPFTSTSMQLGTLIHTAVLEPEKLDDEYYIMPKVDKRTKAGKEDYALHLEKSKGKIIIDDSMIYIKDRIVENFLKNEDAVKYTKGVIELSHYTELMGVPVKVRPDCRDESLSFISDPKTCQDNSPKAFKRDIFKYGYHIQAAFYSDALGVDPKNFIFIAIETNHPYSVQCYSLSDEIIEYGREDYKSALLKWKDYTDSGIARLYDGYEKNENGIIIL
jgi:exodeoxyribonuclease VIII